MLFTLDRLQLINNDLIVFEFIDISDKRLYKDCINHKFMELKIQCLLENFKDNFYLIQYNIQKNKFYLGKNHIEYDEENFRSWFLSLNRSSNINGVIKNSKPLGIATTNLGDPYIQKILQEIYRDNLEFKNVDFSNDDNGLRLVQKVLNGENTYGFDFDLFESSEKVVIEFLKRDNPNITNLTAHPNRYLWNYHKFLSLWNAANIIKKQAPNLFLVNYSDNPDEPINIIKVLAFNKNASSNEVGIISDISYKFSGYKEFLNWLKKLNNFPKEAILSLESFPKETRNINFWQGFGNGKNDIAREIKQKIGQNYL